MYAWEFGRVRFRAAHVHVQAMCVLCLVTESEVNLTG